MIKSNRISVDGFDYFIVPSGFTFVRQSCVKFYGKRLSKAELIKCCQHYISELKFFYSPECLKIGFNLKCFKYYELSVYLHGLVSLYCSKLEYDCPDFFGLFRFSHLPHEILNPEKPLLNVEYAVLHDIKGLDYCVCLTSNPRIFRTYKAMEFAINVELSRKYRLNFVLVNELPF